jgi:hypothetical protein
MMIPAFTMKSAINWPRQDGLARSIGTLKLNPSGLFFVRLDLDAEAVGLPHHVGSAEVETFCPLQQLLIAQG